MRIIIYLVLIILFIYCAKNKIRIRFTTFLKKGFKAPSESFGCYCFTGKQGSGKTYSVCSFIDSIRSKDQKVITNVKSYAERNKFCIYEPNLYDIIDKFNDGTYDCNYIIFYDEIFSLIEKGKLPKKIRNFISQLRKRKLYLVSTAQEWLEINVTFRRYVRFQIDCKCLSYWFLPFSICVNEINDGYQIKWSNLDNEYVAPRIKTTIKKCNKYIGDSYDTYETIDEVIAD